MVLLLYGRKRGELGNRLEQYRDGCQERLSKNTLDRKEQRILSTEKALIGAEKVALAMVLTKFSLLLSSESDIDNAPEALSAQDVLSDWIEPEVKELLRSALFDPSTHGCVQFHHRSMREYLTAQCLWRLLGNNLSFLNLKAELFKYQYGEQVIAHSLKPVVAWLSVLDERFFDLAVEQYPELLMSDGAPDAYRLDQRKRLITAFAKKYATHERVMNIPLEFVARLAHPELAETIQGLWAEHSISPDFRELALELIEAGRIKACTDIVFEVAQDQTLPSENITRAIYALEACKANTELASLAKQIIETPSQFPVDAIINALPALYPAVISSDDLWSLVRGIDVSNSSDKSRLTRQLQVIANNIEALNEVGIEFRTLLSKLIFDTRDKDSRSGRQSQYDYLASVLMIICYRQLTRHITLDPSFLWDCVVASKFQEDRYSNRTAKVDGQTLGEVQLDLSRYRKEVFLSELMFAKTFKDKKGFLGVFRDLRVNCSLVFPFKADDWYWLTELLESGLEELERQVVTWVLHSVWLERKAPEQYKEILKAFVIEADLKQDLNFLFEPVKEDPKEKQCTEEGRLLDQQIAEQECQERKNNLAWRTSLLANPSQQLENEANLVRLYDWLKSYKHEYSYVAWDKPLLADAFSSEVADAVELAFCRICKEQNYSMWSKRDRSSSLPDSARLALCGLYITTQRAHWAQRLSYSEVETATRLMLVELGTFRLSLIELFKSYPVQVGELIANEAEAQLAFISGRSDLPLIGDLYELPSEMVPIVSVTLLAWLDSFILSSRIVHPLANDRVRDVFRFLNRSSKPEQIDEAFSLCIRWLNSFPEIRLEQVLFRALLQLDNKKALKVLIPRFEAYKITDATRALQLFVGLFGHRDFEFKKERFLELVDELVELLIFAYRLVSPLEDVTHKGSFRPDFRDDAQTARNFILSSLISAPGASAYNALLELSKKPDFAHIKQRMVLWASNRAAADTEEKTFSLNEVKASFTAKEFVPYDRDSLFEAMLGKLHEIEDYLKNDDYSNISNWLQAREEKEIQKLLSDRLKERKNGLFSLEREPEVYDQKEPDIRITAPNTNNKAVIEIKHGDKKWSVKDFEEALEKQIAGQYLRADNCRAGVLLITFHGINRQYWQQNGKIHFSELINHLKRKAKDLEKMHGYAFRLGVFGLDLTDA